MREKPIQIFSSDNGWKIRVRYFAIYGPFKTYGRAKYYISKHRKEMLQ